MLLWLWGGVFLASKHVAVGVWGSCSEATGMWGSWRLMKMAVSMNRGSCIGGSCIAVSVQ